MTAIAIKKNKDSIELATDSRTSVNGIFNDNTKKIHKINDIMYLTGTGKINVILLLKEYLKQNKLELKDKLTITLMILEFFNKYFNEKYENETCFVLIVKDKAYIIYSDFIVSEIEENECWSSPSEYEFLINEIGVKKTIEKICQLSIYCGGEVQYLQAPLIIKEKETSLPSSVTILNQEYDVETTTKLDLSSQNLTAIPDGIEKLISLQELDLRGNRISDLSQFPIMPNLLVLKLGDNQISDLSQFPIMPNLLILWLEDNQISDISKFPILPNLQELGLEGNQISDISKFPIMPNLLVLKLGGNQISDLSKFPIMPNLLILWLEGNQISDDNEDDNKYVHALRDRGVTVYL